MNPRPTSRFASALAILTFTLPLLFSALTPLAAATPAALGSSAPVLARPAASTTAPVTIKDADTAYILDNGIVTVRVNKRLGELESLHYRGTDLLGHDQGHVGGWEQDPSAAAKVGGLTQSLTIDPATNGGERGEISIKGVTKGDPKAGLTPGSPGGAQGGTINLDLEIRYTLGRGESGVHVYAIFSHPESYGPLNMPESRYITRLSQAFDWISVDADRNMLECAPTDWGTGVVVHAKEQRLMDKGVYKNSVEHKYSYTAVQYKIPAYGWSSTRDHVGVWFINPTIEYLSGGATKQELVCHYGDNGNPDPILLNYWRGTHYGGGASANIPGGEKWTKVIGPMMIYVNSLEKFATPSPADLATLKATEGNPTVPPAWTANATALWQDALAQAKKENTRWPYAWVAGVDYPLAAERGTVTGQLVLNDPQAASKKFPHLTVGLAYPDAPGSAGANGNAFITVASLTTTPDTATTAASPGTPTAPGGARGPGGRGGPGGFGRGFARPTDWVHDAKHYQFWNDGTEDGRFTLTHNFLEGTIVLDERLDVNVPQERPLIVKSAGYSNVDAKDTHKDDSVFSRADANGRTTYSWKHALLARPTDEELKKKKKEPTEPKSANVQLTTFKNWEAIAAWYAALQQGRTTPNADIKAKAEELTRGRADELEKIRVLYDYVAKNIRYVSLSFGLGRYQPHSAADVFKNQYGDCKDKVTLLAAMLRAIDVPSDAVLIPSRRKIDQSVPSPSQFDHLITAVPYQNSLLWMDSTAEVAPFRLLVSSLRDKYALLVPPDGAGKLVETPADPPWTSTQKVIIDAQVSELGKLTAKLQYFLRGDNELALRVAFRRTPQTQWKELGQTIAALDGIKGEVTAVKPSDPSDTENPFELDLEFSQANFFDWASKKVKMPIPMLSIGLPDASPESPDPVKLGSPLDITVNLKMTLPKDFTVQTPFGVSVDHDYASYKSTYKFADGTLTAERILDFKLRELPASRASEYLTFSRTVESDETQLLAVENPSPGAPSIPSTATADELLESGGAALNAGNARESIPLFKRATELDPKTKQGWNDLGLAYLRLGQFDEAVAAFKKQVEVDPYDEHVYNYLGITLQQQEKYREAADAFKKQIEINPLDPIAHAALGALYSEQHKYSDAVPELDKATVLAPDNAELQVSLGRAYLNTGDKDKALAAFDKSVELAQTPVVWNNVAYNLADGGIDLEKAAQYAESAVSSTSASLRNIQLAHLTLEDLNQVSSIGVYWDTLGWVHFKQGDLDSAERFVRASWLLNQHGEVGDHLAQIYEKRGHKQQAIDMYAQAMAAPHSVPETRARMIVLLGTNTTIDALVANAKPELKKVREFPLADVLKEDAKADFFVMLSPEKKHAVVDGAKFIDGSQDLRPFAEKLRAIDFGPVFPDSSPAKLVRRGTLSCTAATGKCVFTLILPEDVRALN